MNPIAILAITAIGLGLIAVAIGSRSDADAGDLGDDMPKPPTNPAEVTSGIDALIPIFRSAAQMYRVPISILAALSKQESGHNPRAVNIGSYDDALGGSWGHLQLTYATAVRLGYTGLPPDRIFVQRAGSRSFWIGSLEGLLDPQVTTNLIASASIKPSLIRGRSVGDIASIHNSGRTMAQLAASITAFEARSSGSTTGVVEADKVTPAQAAARALRLRATRDVYVPRVIRFQSEYAYLDADDAVS